MPKMDQGVGKWQIRVLSLVILTDVLLSEFKTYNPSGYITQYDFGR